MACSAHIGPSSLNLMRAVMTRGMNSAEPCRRASYETVIWTIHVQGQFQRHPSASDTKMAEIMATDTKKAVLVYAGAVHDLHVVAPLSNGIRGKWHTWEMQMACVLGTVCSCTIRMLQYRRTPSLGPP